MDVSPRIELLTLGDELLLGIRENSLFQYIGCQLSRNGLKLQHHMVVQDNPDEIKIALKNSWERSDIVITTGGLAPVRVNNTRKAIASILSIGLQFLPKIEASICSDFEVIGHKMDQCLLRKCYKLEGSEFLENNYGATPGIWFENNGKILIILFGLASELQSLFDDQVIPRFRERGFLRSSNAYFQFRTIGVNEDSLEERLNPIFKKYTDIRVDYCLHQGIIDVRLSSQAGADAGDQFKKISSECRHALGEDFLCYGHDTLAQSIFDQLRALKKTLAVAESCTGGQLSNAFTEISGISQVFAGGLVCYNNEAKIELLNISDSLIKQHGVVSAEVAAAMATRVSEKFATNYGLSVTGFAGPGGGTSENPVGTVYIGYHSPSGTWAQKVMYLEPRESVKVRAANAALDWMRRKLKKDKVQNFMEDMELE